MKHVLLSVIFICVLNSTNAQTPTDNAASGNNSINKDIQILGNEQGVIESWLSLPANTVDNGISVGNISITGNAITVEALITMQNSLPIPDAYDIISKHSNIFDCNYLFRPNNFAIRTSEGFVGLDNPVVLCLDSTYHVAGTYDGDSVRYFVNGVQVASVFWSGNLFENSHITGIGNLTFSLDYNEQFTGFMDEVRIWNVARTSEEIAINMYNLPDPTNIEGLLAYYKFNGDFSNAQGNMLYDGSPYGLDISLDSNPLYFGTVSSDDCTPISVSETSDLSNILVYPNPTESDIRIQFNTLSPRAELCLLNLFGEIIFQQNISALSNVINYQLDMTTMPNGSYFVHLKSDTENFSLKIMKQE